MVKTMLYIIRHGQTWWNWQKIIQGQSNSELSPKGMEQGRRIAKLLSGENQNFSNFKIITSPIKRAVDYTNIICENLELKQPSIIEPLVREISMGDLEGFPKIAVPTLFPEIWAEREKNPLHFVYPNGESRYSLKERAEQFLNKYTGDLDNTILITHNGFSIALRMLLENLDDEYLINKKISHLQNTIYKWDVKKLDKINFPNFEHGSKFDISLPIDWKGLEV